MLTSYSYSSWYFDYSQLCAHYTKGTDDYDYRTKYREDKCPTCGNGGQYKIGTEKKIHMP